MNLACDCSKIHPGILWPMRPNGDDSLPWVQRCDECDTYDTDQDAAKALADLIGGRVMFAVLEEDMGEDDIRDYARPFVFAFPESHADNDQALVKDREGYFQPSMWTKWLKEREERFGPRRARYDEATSS